MAKPEILATSSWSLIKATPHKKMYVRQDPETGQVIIRETRNEDPVLKQAAVMRDMHEGARKTRSLTPVATIPWSVMQRAITEGWSEDSDMWTRWANDIDNRSLRITEGRV